MIEIDGIRSAISQLCRRLQVKRLDIFGSAATDQFTVDSDVDVLVQFDREPGDLFNRYFDLKEGLEQVFGRPVDVVLEDSLKNPYFKLAIEQGAIVKCCGWIFSGSRAEPLRGLF